MPTPQRWSNASLYNASNRAMLAKIYEAEYALNRKQHFETVSRVAGNTLTYNNPAAAISKIIRQKPLRTVLT